MHLGYNIWTNTLAFMAIQSNLQIALSTTNTIITSATSIFYNNCISAIPSIAESITDECTNGHTSTQPISTFCQAKSYK